jgi:hypothetical protein
MKKILTFLFARVFNRFKVKNPAFYGGVILPALIWIQTQMFDPEVVAFITSLVSLLPVAFHGTVADIITWLPAALVAMTGTHTTEIVEEGRQERRQAKRLAREKDSL